MTDSIKNNVANPSNTPIHTNNPSIQCFTPYFQNITTRVSNFSQVFEQSEFVDLADRVLGCGGVDGSGRVSRGDGGNLDGKESPNSIPVGRFANLKSKPELMSDAKKGGDVVRGAVGYCGGDGNTSQNIPRVSPPRGDVNIDAGPAVGPAAGAAATLGFPKGGVTSPKFQEGARVSFIGDRSAGAAVGPAAVGNAGLGFLGDGVGVVGSGDNKEMNGVAATGDGVGVVGSGDNKEMNGLGFWICLWTRRKQRLFRGGVYMITSYLPKNCYMHTIRNRSRLDVRLKLT